MVSPPESKPNLSAEQFLLPYGYADPIFVNDLTKIRYKTTFDKYYIKQVDDFLSRGEVAHTGELHRVMLASGKTRSMNWGCSQVSYVKNQGEVFLGLFTGEFICV